MSIKILNVVDFEIQIGEMLPTKTTTKKRKNGKGVRSRIRTHGTQNRK